MHCKSDGKKYGNKKFQRLYIIAKTKHKNFKWKHNKSECVFTNTTPAPKKFLIQSQFTY
jgi:hypothetical protein